MLAAGRGVKNGKTCLSIVKPHPSLSDETIGLLPLSPCPWYRICAVQYQLTRAQLHLGPAALRLVCSPAPVNKMEEKHVVSSNGDMGTQLPSSFA